MTNETEINGLTYLSSMLADGAGPTSATSTGDATVTQSEHGELEGILLALTPAGGTTTTVTHTSYDADDEKTSVTDALGRATFDTYNGNDHGSLPRLDHRKSPGVERGGGLVLSVSQVVGTPFFRVSGTGKSAPEA
jgi:hypothetical protein